MLVCFFLLTVYWLTIRFLIENYFDIGYNKRLYNDIVNDINENEVYKINFIKEVTLNPNKYFTTDFLIQIKKNYYKNKKKFVKQNNTTKIVVHIRLGDVLLINDKNKNNNYAYHPDHGIFNTNNIILDDSIIEKGDGNTCRFINNSFYIDIMHKLAKIYNNIEFVIVSQGDEEYFNDIKKNFDNIKFFLNKELLETFELLCNNDILVLGKSSLSYCAGLLSNNIVIANSIQHNWNDKIPTNLSNWKII